MMTTILAAVDPQHEPGPVLRQACTLARQHAGRMTVLHVMPDPWFRHPLMPWRPVAAQADQTLPRRLRANELLAGLVARTEGSTGLDVDVRVESGRPETVIVDTAEALGATTIVVGAPERWTPGANGTVVERVVQHAHCPVLAVRPGPEEGPVLAATDLSDPSLPAIAAGATMAARAGVPFIALHVIDISQFAVMSGMAETVPVLPPPSMWTELGDEAKSQLDAALRLTGATGEAIVEQGLPAAAIVQMAGLRKAGLVVVGTTGATGLRRLLLGSVARDVLHDAPCSVLVVRLHPPVDESAEAVRLVPKPA